MRSQQTLYGVPFVGLFLILSVIVATGLDRSTRHRIDVADRLDPDDCGEYSLDVVRRSTDGSVWLNRERLDLSELGARLRQIFRWRTESVVFVTADPEVPFENVAELIDIARPHVDRVALLTLSVEQGSGCIVTRRPASVRPNPHQPAFEMERIPWWRIW